MRADSEATGMTATGAQSIGFAALFAGAFAFVTVAVPSSRRLVLRNAHIQRVEIDELVVHGLDVRATDCP